MQAISRMSRRTLLNQFGNIAITAGTLGHLARPKPVRAEQYDNSPTIDEIKERMRLQDNKDNNDYCMMMKNRIGLYYKTDVFDMIPCSNQEDVNKIISPLDYLVVMYDNIEARYYLKPTIRRNLLEIYENSYKYPDVQKKLIDIMVNHYKLVDMYIDPKQNSK